MNLQISQEVFNQIVGQAKSQIGEDGAVLVSGLMFFILVISVKSRVIRG